MKNRTVVLCGLVGILAPSIAPFSSVLAGPVTWEVAGEITRVSDPLNLLGGAVQVGTPFLFSYTFELTTPDSQSDPALGIYIDSVLNISGNVGGVPFFGPIDGRENRIRIDDVPFEDLYSASVGMQIVGVDLDMGWGLSGVAGNPFGSDALPVVPPDLGLFQNFGFGIGDRQEVVPLVFSGVITSVVPEPNTLALLALGALMRFRSRFRRAASTAALARVVLCGVFVMLVHEARICSAGDCNGNDILDIVELPPQICKVDIVFVMDTSTSMSDDLINNRLCFAIDLAITNLTASGVIVDAEVLRISSDLVPGEFTPCSCCTSSVVETYGTTVPGLTEMLADCPHANPLLQQQMTREDWGTAAAIVAGKKRPIPNDPQPTDWTPGALRFIVPMSDDQPRCGPPGGNLGK